MSSKKENPRLDSVKSLILNFSKDYLNEEYEYLALNLLKSVNRSKKLNFQAGKPEIWAASILYVIARLNFLFEEDSEIYFTREELCDFFGVKKNTVSNKATMIEKFLRIKPGDERYSSPEFFFMYQYVSTPEGFLIPFTYLTEEQVVQLFEPDEVDDILMILRYLRMKSEQRIQRREALEREKKEKKEKKEKREKEKASQADSHQLSLFEDL